MKLEKKSLISFQTRNRFSIVALETVFIYKFVNFPIIDDDNIKTEKRNLLINVSKLPFKE